MKKVIIGLVIILLLGVGVYFFFFREQKAVIGIADQRLSTRSQEYLDKRSEKKDTALQYAVVAEEKTKSLLKNERVTVGNCFSFLLPFTVWNIRKEGECSMYYAIDNPRGQIVVYEEEQQTNSFDAVPGVSMRRKFPEQYAEETKVLGDKTFLIFQRKQEGYEKSIFYYTSESYFVLNLLSSSTDNLDQKLFEMLESLEFQ